MMIKTKDMTTDLMEDLKGAARIRIKTRAIKVNKATIKNILSKISKITSTKSSPHSKAWSEISKKTSDLQKQI